MSRAWKGVGIGKLEPLVEGKADGAGEGELVLGQLVGGGDQGLLFALVVDLGAKDVETGAGAGLVRVGGLIEGQFGAGQLSLYGFDPGLVGDAEQIGVAHGEHDQVAGVLGG